MSERISSNHRILCQVQLLHHYWLDYGSTLFDDLPKDAAEKAALNLSDATPTREQQLHDYDVRRFIAINPTANTRRLLAGLGGIVKNTASGFVLAVPEGVPLSQDMQLEFALTAANADFFCYTALTLPEQPIVEIFRPKLQKTDRYKKNVSVLSNLTGTVTNNAGSKQWFLSKAIPALADNDRAEALVNISNGLWQLTGDQPGAGRQQLSNQIDKMPVFVHQGDIDPDGILLTERVAADSFGLIRLVASRPDNDEFSLITAAGLPKDIYPLFQVRFKNRASQWQYYPGSTGKIAAPIFVEPEPLPLTFFGNASTANKTKPSCRSINIRLDHSVIPPKVLGIASDIFE